MWRIVTWSIRCCIPSATLNCISDHARDLTRTAQEIHQKKVVFSKQAQEELLVLEAALGELLSITVNCFRDKDLSAAHQVEPLEQVIDDLVRKIKMHHVPG